MIHHGDCIEVMATLPEASVDAIVTDPPYGLEFMGMAWDQFDGRENGTPRPRNEWGDFGSREHARGQDDLHRVTVKKARALQRFSHAWAEAAYRVAKPSAYLLAFGGTRTVHRMTCALEDAGWIIRDMLVWGYASGFPKSKASLKPAWEPIVMARKPGPLRMLAIDECRIGTTVETWPASRSYAVNSMALSGHFPSETQRTGEAPPGRWPANIVLTDPIFDGGIEGVVGGGETRQWNPEYEVAIDRVGGSGDGVTLGLNGHKDAPSKYGDTGTYSRFFLIPKAARSDREPLLGGLPQQDDDRDGSFGLDAARPHTKPDYIYERKPRANVHPTVKPVDLMRHLVRLVTPTGGVVLDPFLGSGTTALAAETEGFEWIGIEREAEYVAIAEARLNGTQKGMAL